MNKQDRIRQILQILEQENGASIKNLAKRLDYTEMTIRRDVKQLTDDGIVRMVSGAVVLNHLGTEADGVYNLNYQKTKKLSEKQKICQKAESLIQDGDIVYFDIGTTVASIIPQLHEDKHITAVCCTMNALLEIHKKGIHDFIVSGGKFSQDLQMFDSREGVELLKKTRITKAFLSAAGVHADLGVTCVSPQEVDIKRTVLENAVEKILVVDSSKFGLVKPSFVAELSEFDAVITDSGILEEWIELLKQRGVTCYIV